MRWAGFVLTGGQSSRMGVDKAFLPFGGAPLVNHQADVVFQAAGSVTLIGDPVRYGSLGYRVCGDRIPGCGPAGGIATALSLAEAKWNLVVACDMPSITVEALRLLLDHTANTAVNCVAALGPDGEPEPLCAVYHSDCLPVLDRAIREKRLKMRDLLRELETLPVRGIDPACLANANTPAEWTEIGNGLPR
jgi:molybdopterin-guanine dinucleotide biosynthesis protein A